MELRLEVILSEYTHRGN